MDPSAELAHAQRESAWTRAKRDAEGIFRSTWFGVALGLVGVIATSVGLLFTAGSGVSTSTQVAVPLLSGALAIALTLLAVVAVQAAAAPVRQRNELRQQWPAGPVERPLDVEISVRNYARRGQLLADRALETYTTDDVRAADAWAEEVVRFLSAHTSTEVARFFITSADNAGGRGPYNTLAAQVAALNEIAKQRAVDDSN